MIKIENVEVHGWESAIRGCRNPLNSWERMDSYRTPNGYVVGPNDHDLMMRLAKAGSEHAKFRRMIAVWFDLTAPLYLLKEFETYKVGTVSNSCSTMHKIHEKEFTFEDFSCEKLYGDLDDYSRTPAYALAFVIDILNEARKKYLETGDKDYWWQMIQLLPSSYNQRRTIMLNYEVLANIYHQRKNHKLDEWREFCKWIKTLPYSEIITLEGNSDE